MLSFLLIFSQAQCSTFDVRSAENHLIALGELMQEYDEQTMFNVINGDSFIGSLNTAALSTIKQSFLEALSLEDPNARLFCVRNNKVVADRFQPQKVDRDINGVQKEVQKHLQKHGAAAYGYSQKALSITDAKNGKPVYKKRVIVAFDAKKLLGKKYKSDKGWFWCGIRYSLPIHPNINETMDIGG